MNPETSDRCSYGKFRLTDSSISDAPREPHHKLEDILGSELTRKFLKRITKSNGSGPCFFERLFYNYDNPTLAGFQKWRWGLYSWLIDNWLRRAKLDKEHMKFKLFHHPPTVKALALTARSIARFGLSEPQRYSAPLFVVWNITNLCNLTCRHCYQNSGPCRTADELTLEEKIYAVDQMTDNYVPFLAVAGGEPLADKDIWEVLAHAFRRGIHLTIASNGTLITPETAARLKEVGVKYVEISIDSVNPEEHDEFRRQQGAWQKAVNGIRNSVAAGIKTGLAACFTSGNVHTANDMVQLAKDIGCSTFSHFNFIPVGRGKEILDQDLTPNQREWLMQTLNDHLQENKITVLSTAPQFGRACIMYGPQDGLFATGHAGRAQGAKTRVLSRYIGGCGAGRCYFAIQPNGIVTPCVYISGLKVGSLRENTLAEIWDCDLFALLSDRSKRGDHCPVCNYRSYCGGCRARAYAYTNDITAGDPGCIFNVQQWNELNSRTHDDGNSEEFIQIARASSA
jgi:radical SAM protein with 4Fe4S-binding SPASM domain